MATTILRTRLDSTRVRQAKEILNSLGLKPSDAINMFMAKIVEQRGIPFNVQQDGYGYLRSEYGVSEKEAGAKIVSLEKQYRRAKRAGSIKRINSLEDLLS